MQTRKCEVCGKGIVPRENERRKQLYCSRNCSSKAGFQRRHDYYKKYWESKYRGLVEKKCELCGNKFMSKSSRDLTCSKKCSKKLWKKKNWEKVLEDQRNRNKIRITKKLASMPDRSCLFCGKIFHPSEDRQHAYKIYCSTSCRQKFNARKATKLRNEILKNPGLSPDLYEKHRLRKQVQDANYKALQRGAERDDDNHISLRSWIEIKDNFNGRCAHCGSDKKITIDHIVPISKGGRNNKENIQPLCQSCNSKKQATVPFSHTSR